MEERRDGPPEQGSGPEPIPADPSPSPVQAHDLYKAHANPKVCKRCSDIDRGRCEAGEELWRDWTAACDEAYQQLRYRTP